MKLSVIIPAFNEEKNILEVINKVKKVNLGNITKEIIIIDDFSTDNTKKILSQLKDSSLKIFFHQKNQGKGASIRTGLKHASGDIILIQDADLEYNPNEYKKLLKPIMENKTKVVYGSRLEAIKKNCEKYLELKQGNEKVSSIAKKINYKLGKNLDLDEIIRALPGGNFSLK